MVAASTNLVCDQGSTFNVTVTWKDANEAANDVTNYNGRMDIRFAQTKEADLVLQLTQANGRITRKSPFSSGKFQLLISAADTAALTAGEYFYDFEVFTIDGRSPVEVQRLIQGKFTVRPEVTG
jgi:hypothetical protein